MKLMSCSLYQRRINRFWVSERGGFTYGRLVIDAAVSKGHGFAHGMFPRGHGKPLCGFAGSEVDDAHAGEDQDGGDGLGQGHGVETGGEADAHCNYRLDV